MLVWVNEYIIRELQIALEAKGKAVKGLVGEYHWESGDRNTNSRSHNHNPGMEESNDGAFSPQDSNIVLSYLHLSYNYTFIGS